MSNEAMKAFLQAGRQRAQKDYYNHWPTADRIRYLALMEKVQKAGKGYFLSDGDIQLITELHRKYGVMGHTWNASLFGLKTKRS